MSDDKSGGWFPNFNHLLIVLLAGTLFVGQEPFHQSRPSKLEILKYDVHVVDARSWQDPFEAVEKYIEQLEKNGKSKNLTPNTTKIINNKFKIFGNDVANVVAVMLPESLYFEDSETRRKLRYAVLSGFNAALRYMPEDSNHIRFFIDESTGHRIVYEWLVYNPTDLRTPPSNDEDRPYQRPPVLVLWLNNEDYKVKPHNKLKNLIDGFGLGKQFYVSVLGPFDSDGLQDLVNEMVNIKRADKDHHYDYYSPSATIHEKNLLYCCELPDLYRHFWDYYFHSCTPLLLLIVRKGNCTGNAILIIIYHFHLLLQLIKKTIFLIVVN